MIQACYLDIWCSSPFCLTGEIISHPRKASRTSGEATPSDRALSNSSQQYGACFTTTVFYIISINIISYKKSSRPSGSFQEVHLLSMASGTQYSRKTSWELHSFEDKPFSHEIQETTGMSCQLTTPQKSTGTIFKEITSSNREFSGDMFGSILPKLQDLFGPGFLYIGPPVDAPFLQLPIASANLTYYNINLKLQIRTKWQQVIHPKN